MKEYIFCGTMIAATFVCIYIRLSLHQKLCTQDASIYPLCSMGMDEMYSSSYVLLLQ